jgi:YD repeat-containing protein
VHARIRSSALTRSRRRYSRPPTEPYTSLAIKGLREHLGPSERAAGVRDPPRRDAQPLLRAYSGANPLGIPIDPNGNVLSKVEGTDTWAYTWNALNQLTKVEKNGVEQARFSYDPKGRRVERVAAGVTTAFTYDARDSLREVRLGTTRSFVHGPGIDEPLASDDGVGRQWELETGLNGW